MTHDDSTGIHDRLLTLEIKSEERHKNMRDALTSIKDDTQKINAIVMNLNCKTHQEKMKGHGTSIALLWTIMISVVLLGIGLGVFMQFGE